MIENVLKTKNKSLYMTLTIEGVITNDICSRDGHNIRKSELSEYPNPDLNQILIRIYDLLFMYGKLIILFYYNENLTIN